MDSRRTMAVVGLGALLALPSAAAAAPKPIKGKLSKRGYTVIALATDGTARTAKANRSFKVRPTRKVVTLQLRDRHGAYAGPVVVGGSGRKVVVGVRAGAKLGRVKVKNGYAVARADRAHRVKRMSARARRGKPIGAGILGRVRAGVSGKDGLGRDYDRDGLPGAFDVDDDGDLVFDNVDRSLARSAVTLTADVEQYDARWIMNAGLQVSYISDAQGKTHGAAGYALNQNAAGPFAASGEFEKLRDLVMIERGAIIMPLPSEASELDCGGLSYCSPGGTGTFITRRQPFPEAFDDDGDGFGLMTAVPGFAEGQDGLGLIQTTDPKTVFGLAPQAPNSEVRAGDAYLARPVRDNTLGVPIMLRSVYGTLPALESWSDGTRTVPISYPVPAGSEGSESNAFTVKPDASGDYVVALKIWRPQREAIEGSGEGTGWIDLGGLTYTVVGKTAEQNRRLFKCPGATLDQAVDQPVSRANTLTLSVNLTDCLKGSGIDWKPPGPTIDLFVAASSAYGDVAEGLGFSFKPIAQGSANSSDYSGTWKFVGSVPSNEIEWTITANKGSTSRAGVIVYNNRTVTGGTAPDGWTCTVARAQRDGDMWLCDGGPLTAGQSITGRTTLDAPYDTSTPIDMLICTNTCQGFGMVYKP